MNANFIQDLAYKNYGYKIEVVAPYFKTGLTPSICFKTKNLLLLNDDNSKALELKNLKIKLKVLPLLFKNIYVDTFSADEVYANIFFDKNNNFKLGKYDINFPVQQNFGLKNINIYFKTHNIFLNDESLNKLITYNGSNFLINTNEKYLNFSTDANFNFDKKKSRIKINSKIKLPLTKISQNHFELNGQISNLDLSDFSQYAKVISKGQIESLSGLINLTSSSKLDEQKNKIISSELILNNFLLSQKDKPAPIYSNGTLKINSDINILKNTIGINSFSIIGNGINMITKGLIKDVNAKFPILDLNITIKDSRAENVLALAPNEPDLNPDINLMVLKQTGFWGNVNGDLKIQGKADFPNVYGKISITDAYLMKPIRNAQKANIELDFVGEKMNLDVTVPTSNFEEVLVKGNVILDKDRTSDLNISSSKNVDLKTAQTVLNPLHEILRFDIGPIPIMDIKGQGGIKLHVTGTRKDPHGWGQFWFNNAEVSFNDINNMTLKNGVGVLDFYDQQTYFKTEKANLNGKPISVNGSCSLLGNLDFKIIAQKQDLNKLMAIVKSSPMLIDIQKLLSPIDKAMGTSDLSLNLTGQVKDINNIEFNKNIFATGILTLNSNSIKLKDMPIWLSKTFGIINFKNLDADFNLKTSIENSKLKLSGKIKENICDLQISSNKFIIADGLKTLSFKIPYAKDLATINSTFTAKYNGNIENIDFNKLNIKGKIFSNKGTESNIIVNDANFEFANSHFKLPTLNGYLKGEPFSLTADVTNTFSSKQLINAYCKFTNFNLSVLKDLQAILPNNIVQQLNEIDIKKGNINLSARIRNNSLRIYTILDDLELFYKPEAIDLKVNNGAVLFQDNVLNINKLNILLGEMPLFINGKILNIYKKPKFNLYINTKPTQEFADQFFNDKSVYPIKIKGDVILTSQITGLLDALNARTILDIANNSNIYYMGASLGDTENPVKITVDETYYPNKIAVNSFEYDKYILSQNNKPVLMPQLKASGVLNLLPNNIIGFENFKIKTETPTDAKIFNIIFRKPFMKQGVFVSDIILNGTSINPKILGKFDITSIDIPFFDSTVRDINLDFKPNKINVVTKGTVLTNEVKVNAVLDNKLTPPYIIEDLTLLLANLNVNKILDTLRDIEAEATRKQTSYQTQKQFDTSQLIIKNATIAADKISVRNIEADDFSANLTLDNDNIMKLNDFKFSIAEGSVNGNLDHNIKNHKTNLTIHLNDANALVMSEALFDLKGQIYGSVNGDFALSCNGSSQESCFKSLSGNGTFDITDGRMPKLGSLEYLLKAGNLLKGGITGLSINSIIDLITPLKTGNFESIYGSININNGIANDIEIYSKGHDLNMYMNGSYNLVTSIADMKIFGSLSKNITTVFGKIKNASLSTLFNTIPGINNSNETILIQDEIIKIPNIKNSTDIFRIFAVDINGDINGENYVKSFEWVN